MIKPSERDWPEDFKHENGKYGNRCLRCMESFLGHKRRTTCRLCAMLAAPVEAQQLKFAVEAMFGVPVGEPLQYKSVKAQAPVITRACLAANVVNPDGTHEYRTIPSLAGVELKSLLDAYRQHQIGTSGLSVPYNKIVEYLDNEVQRLVQDFLKGIV